MPQVAQALDDGGALVSYGGMSLRPITLPATVLQVKMSCNWCSVALRGGFDCWFVMTLLRALLRR